MMQDAGMLELTGRSKTPDGVEGNDVNSSFKSVLVYVAVTDSQLVPGN